MFSNANHPVHDGIVRFWTFPRAINLTDEELDIQIPFLYRTYRLNRKGLGEHLIEKQRRLSIRGCKGKFRPFLDKVEIPRSSAYEIIRWYNAVAQLNTALLEAAEIGIGWAKMLSPRILKSLNEISNQLNGRVPTGEELTKRLKPFSTHEVRDEETDQGGTGQGAGQGIDDGAGREAAQGSDEEPDVDSEGEIGQDAGNCGVDKLAISHYRASSG